MHSFGSLRNEQKLRVSAVSKLHEVLCVSKPPGTGSPSETLLCTGSKSELSKLLLVRHQEQLISFALRSFVWGRVSSGAGEMEGLLERARGRFAPTFLIPAQRCSHSSTSTIRKRIVTTPTSSRLSEQISLPCRAGICSCSHRSSVHYEVAARSMRDCRDDVSCAGTIVHHKLIYALTAALSILALALLYLLLPFLSLEQATRLHTRSSNTHLLTLLVLLTRF